MKELIARRGQLLEDHLRDVEKNILRNLPKEFEAYFKKERKWKQIKEAIRLTGFLHDIGKGEISIQKALSEDKRPSLSHSTLSLPFFSVAVRKRLGLEPFENEAISAIAFSLLSHHSVPHPELEDNLISRINIKKVQFPPEVFEVLLRNDIEISEDEVLSELKKWIKSNREEIHELQLTNVISKLKTPFQRRLFVIVYNALIKADWASASGDKFRVRNIKPSLSLKSNKLIEPSRSNIHSYVHKSRTFSNNLLLEMPTGFGKTYIGTAYAFKTGRKRIIYTLPITTIIEDVYERLAEKLGQKNVTWYTSKHLAIKIVEDDNYSYDAYQDARYFNAPVIVTTLDQVLMTWLNMDRYPLKEFSIYNSCIVLDEPQLYSPFMLLLFSKLFPEYADVSNLVVMSATIPNFLRKNLNGIVREPFQNKTGEFFKRYSRTYFDLTYLKSPLMIEERLIDEAVRLIERHIKNGDKLAIVVNTVLRAQQIFDKITELNLACEKFLFHARYMLKDKRNKLIGLKNLLNEKKPAIIVTTQLIEAGVNLSFDAMIRELAPLDSLVQSAGRVNRCKGSNNTSKPIYIFSTKNFLPYRKHQIEITTDLLKNWPKLKESEFIYYKKLSEYWNRIENWIIKDENEADKILKCRDELSPFGIKLSEKAIDFRGGYITISVVPQDHISEVLSLLKRKDQTKNFWEKRKISAMIKNYMVEVPLFGKATKYGKFRDYISCVDRERYPWLNMLTLKYNKFKGVIPEKDNIL